MHFLSSVNLSGGQVGGQGYSNTSVWECIALKVELKLKSSSSVSSVFGFVYLFSKCCNYQKLKIWLTFFYWCFCIKAAPPWCTLWAWILGSSLDFQPKMDVGISQLKYPQLLTSKWSRCMTSKVNKKLFILQSPFQRIQYVCPNFMILCCWICRRQDVQLDPCCTWVT